jgi:hypothetical protein
MVTLKAELAAEGQDQGLQVVFPTPAWEDGQRVLSAFGAASAA